MEDFFNYINNNDFETLTNIYFEGFTSEGLKKRYNDIWKNLTNGYGKYKGLKVLHTMPNIYEGKFELQFFTELQFENGCYYVRVFRNHAGRMHVQRFPVPTKFEQFPLPIGNNKFLTYNIKLGTSSTIKFIDNGLIVNENSKLVFKKIDPNK